ncbi:MAG: acetyl-CoA carboxylase biotin carboxyl carrier protein subunit, partial [Bifidobacterium crudilactis]|nr:acetyl-CoA carboxylase biotin carboxyl carrier protein subunit [Bifidobacterium crudilactis]
TDSSRSGVIVATMQAVVTRINVAQGQKVDKGDLLVVLESMKMENYVYAPCSGTVSEVEISVADGVDPGETLVKLDVQASAAGKGSDNGQTGDGSGSEEPASTEQGATGEGATA